MLPPVIRPARPADREGLAHARCALWPALDAVTSLVEVDAILGGATLGGLPWALLLADDLAPDGRPAGFAEVSLRSHVDGCNPSQPVGFLEGWWVKPSRRDRGLGRALVEAAMEWAASHGCVEFASDADADNRASRLAHAALGFEASTPTITFRRPIRLPPDRR